MCRASLIFVFVMPALFLKIGASVCAELFLIKSDLS